MFKQLFLLPLVLLFYSCVNDNVMMDVIVKPEKHCNKMHTKLFCIIIPASFKIITKKSHCFAVYHKCISYNRVGTFIDEERFLLCGATCDKSGQCDISGVWPSLYYRLVFFLLSFRVSSVNFRFRLIYEIDDAYP